MMNNRYTYRGKSIVTDNWVYGYYIEVPKSMSGYVEYVTKDKISYIVHEKMTSSKQWIVVDPKTVGAMYREKRYRRSTSV